MLRFHMASVSCQCGNIHVYGRPPKPDSDKTGVAGLQRRSSSPLLQVRCRSIQIHRFNLLRYAQVRPGIFRIRCTGCGCPLKVYFRCGLAYVRFEKRRHRRGSVEMPAAIHELLVSEQVSFDDAVTFGGTIISTDQWPDETDSDAVESQDYELMFANRAEIIVGCCHRAMHNLSL